MEVPVGDWSPGRYYQSGEEEVAVTEKPQPLARVVEVVVEGEKDKGEQLQGESAPRMVE